MMRQYSFDHLMALQTTNIIINVGWRSVISCWRQILHPGEANAKLAVWSSVVQRNAVWEGYKPKFSEGEVRLWSIPSHPRVFIE
jgi:hypothetical protein